MEPASTVPSASIPSLEELRTFFPELEILEILVVGGMGAVYKARQPRVNRIVALKIVDVTPDLEDDFALRFERATVMKSERRHRLPGTERFT